MNSSLVRLRELIGILVLTAALFFPSLFQSFVSWDDEGHLTENRLVRSLNLDNIKSIFQSDVNKTYIPLTVLSFAIEHHFFGFNPFVYHLNNLLLHLGIVGVIYILALRLGFTSFVAGVSALLFAIHPMHVESVVWVTQRKDVLYSFFYVLSLWQYLVYVQDKKFSGYLGAVIFGILSILSKPMAMSLPLIICLLDWYLKRPLSRIFIIEKLILALCIFPIAWMTYEMNMRVIDFQFPLSILVWIWCFVFYILKFLCPVELLVLYQLPQPLLMMHPELIISGVLFVLLVYALFRFKSNRIFLFSIGYFVLSVFFLLRFDQKQDLTIVSDRFMYLSSLGLCILIGWGVDLFFKSSQNFKKEFRILIQGGFVLLFIVMCGLTHMRIKNWGDEEVLWGQVAKKYDNGLAYTQLGNFYLKQGDFPQALNFYNAALLKLPTYSKPYSNRGIIFLNLGRYEEALEDFNRAIEFDKVSSPVTYTNRGYALMLMRQYTPALKDFNQAIAIDPFYIPAILNRATLFKNLQNYSSAMNDLKRVLSIDPKNTVALNNIQILDSAIQSLDRN